MKKKGHTLAAAVKKARELRQIETGAERTLWMALRNRALAGLKFRRQHPFAQFVLDFYCAEKLLAVELDGGIHQESDRADHDEARTIFLAQHGVRVLRFKNEEIEQDLPGVLRQIVAAALTPLSGAQAAPGPSPAPSAS